MNLRKFGLMILIITSLGILGGCGNEVPSNQEVVAEESNVSIERPDGKADLIGKVKDIVGNEVTVYKVTDKTQDETSTFIIPVGAPIVSMKFINGERNLEQQELTAIKKDGIISIWKKDDGTVEFVELRGGRGKNKDSARTGGGPPMGGMK